jgi:type I restriction enzyme M protein
MTHSEIVSFIWGVADLIRDTFRRGNYQDVILPFVVLRRLDCVLAPTKKKVLETNAKFTWRPIESNRRPKARSSSNGESNRSIP